MRKRERDQVAAVARQRLERLSAELAGLRPPLGPVTRAEVQPAGRAFEVAEADHSRRDDRGGDWGAGSGDAWGDAWGDDRGDDWGDDRGDDRGDAAGAAARRALEGPVVAAPPRPAGWRAIGPRAEVCEAEPPLRDPEPRLVAAPGRHLQRRGDGLVAGWLEDRLPDALRGRVRLRPQHGSVVLALVGVALAVAGWLTLRSGAHQETVPTAKLVGSTSLPTVSGTMTSPGSGRAGGTQEAGPSGGAAGDASGAPTANTGSVVVDVAGKVRHPGIVTLPVGSRVHDAILKAGGARRGVPLTAINLARPLVDGEQIVVGATNAPGGTAPPAAGTTPAVGALVNINSAGLSELDTLPGVGPVTAQKILDWRAAHGAFSAVDELLEVDGIGEKTLADIAPHVTL